MKTKKDKENRIANKQRIAELKKQKKMTEKELDDLNGRTTKGKIASFFVFLLIMAVMAGTLIGMVKFNAGGVADNVLAPVIADVPVARSILPKRLQKKNASEIAAEKKAAADAKAAEKAKKEAEKKRQRRQKQRQTLRRRHRHKLLLRLKSRPGRKHKLLRKHKKKQR